jgi:26S proteasome regulatory subunit N1
MAPKDQDAITISVESTGGKDDSATKKLERKKPEEEVTDTLSDEDRELRERLDTCVSTLINKDNEALVTFAIRLKALDVIVTELRTATSSMTSVPKPLKFLRPHFGALKGLYNQIQNETITNDNDMLELRARVADVLAVLAMTLGKPEGAG